MAQPDNSKENPKTTWQDYGLEKVSLTPQIVFGSKFKCAIDDVNDDRSAVILIDQLKRALRGRIRAKRHYADTPLSNALDGALDEIISTFDLAGTPGHYAGFDQNPPSWTNGAIHPRR